jgi:hypothetical protein
LSTNAKYKICINDKRPDEQESGQNLRYDNKVNEDLISMENLCELCKWNTKNMVIVENYWIIPKLTKRT